MAASRSRAGPSGCWSPLRRRRTLRGSRRTGFVHRRPGRADDCQGVVRGSRDGHRGGLTARSHRSTGDRIRGLGGGLRRCPPRPSLLCALLPAVGTPPALGRRNGHSPREIAGLGYRDRGHNPHSRRRAQPPLYSLDFHRTTLPNRNARMAGPSKLGGRVSTPPRPSSHR